MKYPHTPGPLAPPAMGNGLISACLDHALAILRGAGSIATHMAGASLVGFLRDGGAPIIGGESSVSFWGLGGGSEGFVNVVQGGLKGGRYWAPGTARGHGEWIRLSWSQV